MILQMISQCIMTIGTQSMQIESRLGVWTQCDLRLSDFLEFLGLQVLPVDEKRGTEDNKVLAV